MTDATTLAAAALDALAALFAGWITGLPDAERVTVEALLARAAIPRDDVEGFQHGSSFLGSMKGLQAQDRMGNFEIQRLMSAFNQAETLASSVLRKVDDAARSNIAKI